MAFSISQPISIEVSYENFTDVCLTCDVIFRIAAYYTINKQLRYLILRVKLVISEQMNIISLSLSNVVRDEEKRQV
jgi:hypothetical protein